MAAVSVGFLSEVKGQQACLNAPHQINGFSFLFFAVISVELIFLILVIISDDFVLFAARALRNSSNLLVINLTCQMECCARALNIFLMEVA